MASGNSNSLRDTLRQSLNDVLSEVNLDSGMMGSQAERIQGSITHSKFGFSGMTHGQSTSVGGKDFSSFLSPSSRNFAMGSSQFRPSAAFGVSSEELILAAAAEKRMLEEKRMLMDFERARMAASIRQRALEETLQRRRHNESLLGLFHRGFGGQTGFQQNFTASQKDLIMKQQEQPKDALQELGTSLRNKTAPYVDVSSASDPDPNDTTVKKTRGGVTEPFPEKLHRLLKEIEDDGNGDAISFFSHGRAFGIHDTDKFINDVMPKYFKQSRLSSFQRQLNLYGFKRITSGPDAGGYYHELFLKGRPNLCLHMRRVGLPKGEDRRKMRSKNVQVDPDFYSMKPVTTSS